MALLCFGALWSNPNTGIVEENIQLSFLGNEFLCGCPDGGKQCSE
jgi:hypothetical protein